MALAATEYERATRLLRSLCRRGLGMPPTHWDRWNVRSIALHLIGTAAANASIREQVRQGPGLQGQGVGGEPVLVGRRE